MSSDAPAQDAMRDDEKRSDRGPASARSRSRESADGPDVDEDATLPSVDKYANSRVRRWLTPKRCRWDPKSPPEFTIPLCILYALSAAFTVSNLYYNQAILNRMAQTFNVTYEQSSQVATLIQAGYAAGIVIFLPLGDLLERRLFIITLITMTATFWIALCVTPSFTVFRAISFICGAMSVTPQLMIPLVGDFAPQARRGFSISIIVSGVLLGMLTARLLSGVLANFTSWRNVYWFACGAQYLLSLSLYTFMPDYPSTNPDGLSYLKALWSIPCIVVTQPVLIQSCLIVFFLCSTFTNLWTTLSFLLSSPPFDYDSLTIGLLSLLSIFSMIAVPAYGRVIDRFIPLFSIIFGLVVVLAGILIGTFTGTFTVAGPIIQIVATDFGFQIAQVANRASIFAIDPKARNRINTAYMAAAFAGQLTGTAVGNRLYAAGGWKWSGAYGIAAIVASIICAVVRGPRENGWFGWTGGWRLRRDPPPPESRGRETGIREEKA